IFKCVAILIRFGIVHRCTLDFYHKRLCEHDITAIITVLPLPVKAATFLVTERAALKGNDEVNWNSLGKVFNPSAPAFSAFLPNSFLATSQRGLGLLLIEFSQGLNLLLVATTLVAWGINVSQPILNSLIS
ncbi:MAG: hypothetical protein V7K60_21510, partial [Nostoc sp.]